MKPIIIISLLLRLASLYSIILSAILLIFSEELELKVIILSILLTLFTLVFDSLIKE